MVHLSTIVPILIICTRLLHFSNAFQINPLSNSYSVGTRSFIHPNIELGTTTRTSAQLNMSTARDDDNDSKPHCEHVLFVECGFGNDSHGQNPTKAAVRACRNAIEFNSIPSINRLVPGGYNSLKLDIILAIPKQYQDGLDLKAVSDVFPYGETKFTIQDGGMVAPSGIAIDALGDKNDDMVVVCCAVTVGY